MGAGHAHALYVHEHTPLHHTAPEVKIAAVFGFVVCVALTPREAVWAFGLYAIGVIAATRIGRVPMRFVIARLAAVLPFILFALLIPFVATGERVELLGVSVSRIGLWASWNVFAKAVLGASASIVLTATTEVSDLILGLGRLRVPAVITAIATFMVRYLELVAAEIRRMRVAMTARGYDPRWLWQARPIAASAGALFVRSYERGERVHAAMLSRGFSGTMPELRPRRATRGQWIAAGGVVTAAAVVLALAVTL